MANRATENLEMKVPSVMEYLDLVNSVAEEICKRLRIDEFTQDTLTNSVVEACTNAMEHGNRMDAKKTVTLRFVYDESRIDIYVSDEGDGFDLAAVESPVTPENLLRERGRGIFILKSFMDEVHFDIKPSVGTTVHLVKNLGQSAEAAN